MSWGTESTQSWVPGAGAQGALACYSEEAPGAEPLLCSLDVAGQRPLEVSAARGQGAGALREEWTQAQEADAYCVQCEPRIPTRPLFPHLPDEGVRRDSPRRVVKLSGMAG